MNGPIKIALLLLVALLFMAPALRLFAESRRSQKPVEFWAALYFFGAGVGLPLRLYGSSIAQTLPELASTINLVGHLFFASGTIAMTIFTWRVFHPASRLAKGFAIATIIGIITTTALLLAAGLESAERSVAMMATNFARVVPTYWACIESYKYWRAMRKQRLIGLGDPVVANRFLLWATWTFSVSILPTAALSLRALEKLFPVDEMGSDFTETTRVVLLGMRLLFLFTAPIAVTTLCLSFFPPKRYVDRVRAIAQATRPA